MHRLQRRLAHHLTVHGASPLPEQTLDRLDGYRGSRPVRIGNAAAVQWQLDVYGEVLDAALYCIEEMGPPRAEFTALLDYVADAAARRWREPDYGIWEVRGGPRHFLHSKLLCWVALDRAIRLKKDGDHARTRYWKATCAEIRETICVTGYDANLGAFTQTLGEPVLDASSLLIPLLGFLPPTDARVRSTVQRVRERLTSNGLVYRYLNDDGLPGGEATFTLCSFWLVDNLALAEDIDAARRLFEKLVGYANDVGLLAEEIVPATGELLGNFPKVLRILRSSVPLSLSPRRKRIAALEESLWRRAGDRAYHTMTLG